MDSGKEIRRDMAVCLIMKSFSYYIVHPSASRSANKKDDSRTTKEHVILKSDMSGRHTQSV